MEQPVAHISYVTTLIPPAYVILCIHPLVAKTALLGPVHCGMLPQ